MAHMLEDLYVPVEVLGCIASHFDAAATLLAFECAASSCRRATAGAWRNLTLSRFPRVEDILRLSPMPAPSFRELFRRQIAAALPPPRPSLADFILSVELSVDGEMTHSWTGPYWESGQGEGGAAPRLWPGEPPPWFRPFIAISKDNDHLVSRDGAEGWAVPAALAEAYTCTVTVTHALRSARLYSGRPSLVCASRDDCVVFDERRLPPLFSPPDPSSWQDEEQEAGFSLVRVDPAHDVRCRAHLSHAGGRGAGGGHLELDFGNETGRLNGRQALLEYLLLLTARVAG
ncbi:hypothetical protein EMIHUDRAFT_437372 [Emiliania huxleyi CCMP1516]|uniref:F-box domain-containing protein n=4 Tax=Emiliania huxleyi TaxID=2903 RepID=A0A0D3IME4_EMIH1|nr:hypothetical protein EMIHUDRAFT_437372 [Emiliania huxleyi CCMP1516]EOD12429.1 hypothetical protein EMIHUDRAFT_437372 [Emiliania huxleyi CCMP1516]|eukprot:XP_005764858.1 hypothetical protein EMIHUDRAFT_437372 [Emiliania huxleyi CCMP1516]